LELPNGLMEPPVKSSMQPAGRGSGFGLRVTRFFNERVTGC
jgi:hypothetical protein